MRRGQVLAQQKNVKDAVGTYSTLPIFLTAAISLVLAAAMSREHKLFTKH